jgi:adenylate cyclase, class 2
MALEVEVKYRTADRKPLIDKLVALGVSFVGEERHRDTYFAPPHRDFAKTDEALRIRRTEAVGWITYKGPKIDAATKTRREVEAPLEPASAEALAEILKELSFTPVREVVKTRSVYATAYRGFPVTIAFDEVQGLEGGFVELEIHAEEEELPDATGALLSLAKEMHLENPERRSYLELLLASGAE